MSLYYQPEKYGLTVIGSIDWSSGCYEFDLTVVWQRGDGRFLYGEDTGCSCPAPFEDHTVDSLTLLAETGGLEEFKQNCDLRQAGPYVDGDRSMEVADLLERMHQAGAR